MIDEGDLYSGFDCCSTVAISECSVDLSGSGLSFLFLPYEFTLLPSFSRATNTSRFSL